IGGDFLAREYAHTAGLHIGRRNEKLDVGERLHSFEIDETLDQILERIDVERVEIVRDIRSNQACTGEPSAGVNDNSRSTTARCTGGRSPVLLTERQKSVSRFCASARPPRANPSVSMIAFMAPDDVPDTPSITRRSSLNKCSSTPHVKAPCAPPP